MTEKLQIYKDMENQEQINNKQGEILSLKAYLNDTDYKVSKAFETKTEIDAETLQKRAEARARINELETEIKELYANIDNEILSNIPD